ncbi:hypothetical protein [Maricaulis sp.]|uniref:hypothetical protein n=1 Tax=Maricaulis sp. TaxID=1486257 RepID=UPI002628473F|nr:hypothetical protein [Maricaulis sp.]
MHQYEVELSDGSKHLVNTPHHHDDHPQDTFHAHLLNVLENALGGIIAGVAIRVFRHKGRIR